jgi:hypothetical protein
VRGWPPIQQKRGIAIKIALLLAHSGKSELFQNFTARHRTPRLHHFVVPEAPSPDLEARKKMSRWTSFFLAEREGFEPSVSYPTPLFESGQFNHSCTSPYSLLFYHEKGMAMAYSAKYQENQV